MRGLCQVCSHSLALWIVCQNAKIESDGVKQEKKLLLVRIHCTAPTVLEELCKDDEQSWCGDSLWK